MSTAPASRPQLTLDEMYQLKWLLGGALTLLAVWTVFYMNLEGWTVMVMTTVAATVCLVRPTLPARLPGLVHTLAFPVIVAFFLVDLWLNGEVLPAMVRLDMLLLLYRGITYRQRRDDLQVVVLGLFLIVVAGVLTVSLLFAVQILLYTACALGFLLTITLVGAADPDQTPPPAHTVPAWAARTDWRTLFRRLREVADWRVLTLGGVLFAGVVGLSALLFLAIPRFQLENSLFLERFVVKKARTGFTDTIKFGDVSEIQQDSGVALTVDVSDRTQVPADPYWRMLVLDQYDRGTFKLSPELRFISFRGGERTGTVAHGRARPRLGAANYWTFYLESGVSRYLPLSGDYEQLRFTELHNFSLAPSLALVALRDEPVLMTAYRVEGPAMGAALPDPDFAVRWRERATVMPVRAALQNRLGVSQADQARLKQMVAEFAGGPTVPAAGDFVRLAAEWLKKNHNYSLTPKIPNGEGDTLVRWMASQEAGHCELFAGALVLLARSAGMPARVVTGFRGGSWNGYSNNFTVRNSDAHAWAEIFDVASGAWLRADALANVTETQAAQIQDEAALAARADRSWTARFDSLRVFWYRRIVNFDQRSQVETLKAVKDATQQTAQRFHDVFAEIMRSARAWLASPWDGDRLFRLGATVVLMGALVWWCWTQGGGWLRRRMRWSNSQREDPVRVEAGRWLARLRSAEVGTEELTDLQRLRFGARATWPEPEKIFRRARRTWREARSTRSRQGA